MKIAFKWLQGCWGLRVSEIKKKQILTRAMESDHLKRAEGMANFFLKKCHKLLLIPTLS